MAHTILRTLELGLDKYPRNYIVHYVAISDGASGELSNSRINVTSGDIKVIDSTHTGTNSIIDCHVSTTIASAVINFDATTPLQVINIPPNFEFNENYQNRGGLKNSANGTAGYTGDLTLSTNGFNAAGAKISVDLHIRVK